MVIEYFHKEQVGDLIISTCNEEIRENIKLPCSLLQKYANLITACCPAVTSS